MNSLNLFEFTTIKDIPIIPKVINGIPINKKLNSFKTNIAPIRPRTTFKSKLIILSKNITIVD